MTTALVVWESMFGNTRAVAEAVADGLRTGGMDAQPSPVSRCPEIDMTGVDLLVVGGPTHVRGMSRPRTRTAAVEKAAEPDSGRHLESGATGPGLREWLESKQTGSGARPPSTPACPLRPTSPDTPRNGSAPCYGEPAGP